MTRSLFLPLTLNQTSINVPPLSILHEALVKTSSMSVIQNSSDSMGSKKLNHTGEQGGVLCWLTLGCAKIEREREKRQQMKYNRFTLQNNILSSPLLVTLKVKLATLLYSLKRKREIG